MKKYLNFIWRYTRAFALIYLCLYIGKFSSNFIALPDSIIGMIVLFFMLVFRIIPEHWVAPACDVLMRYMVLLFIPICVGVMVNYPAIESALLPLSIACIISSILIMIIVGNGIQWYERHTLILRLRKWQGIRKEKKQS